MIYWRCWFSTSQLWRRKPRVNIIKTLGGDRFWNLKIKIPRKTPWKTRFTRIKYQLLRDISSWKINIIWSGKKHYEDLDVLHHIFNFYPPCPLMLIFKFKFVLEFLYLHKAFEVLKVLHFREKNARHRFFYY